MSDRLQQNKVKKILIPVYSSFNERLEYIKSKKDDITQILTKYNHSLCVSNISGFNFSYKVVWDKKTKRIRFAVKKRLGVQESMDGEAHAVCYPVIKMGDGHLECAEHHDNIAIKMIPLTITEINNKFSFKYKTWRELHLLMETSKLIDKNICPNFQYFYDYSICDETNIPLNFENKNILDTFKNEHKIEKIIELRNSMMDIIDDIVEIKYFRDIKQNLVNIKNDTNKVFKKIENTYIKNKLSNSSLVIFNELAHYDFITWLNNMFIKKTLNKEIIESILLQVYIALIALGDLGFIHMDLHLGNVLISEIKNIKNSYWIYIIKKKTYYVPNYGYHVKIWDFGRAMSYDIDSPQQMYAMLLHQIKRFFKEEYYKKYIIRINEQFEGKKNKKTFDLMKSFDIFRFTNAFLNKLENENEKKYDKIKEKMDNIITDSIADFIENLASNNKPEGTPSIIIDNYFTHYTKKPKNMVKLNDNPFIVA